MLQKKTFKRIGIASVVVAGLGAAGFAAFSSPSMNTAKLELISSVAAHEHGRYHHRGKGMKHLCSDERTKKLEDGIQFVEAFFSFNEEQQKAWGNLATTLREGSVTIGKYCDNLGERPTTAPEKLARAETMLAAGHELVQDIRPSFESFYGTLDAKQQAALDKLHQRHGRR